jgi:hypothetical protein
MKKIISTIVASLFISTIAFAAAPVAKKAAPAPAARPAAAPAHTAYHGNSYSRPYGMAGCGLGSILIEKNHMQISAATSNAYSQLFGISSGTSNCVENPTSAKADRMDKYIIVNKVALADDIARGEGETIQGLAQIMNCQEANMLGSRLQSSFATIFPSHEVSVNDITDHIITVVGQDESLSAACGVAMVSAL